MTMGQECSEMRVTVVDRGKVPGKASRVQKIALHSNECKEKRDEKRSKYNIKESTKK